MSSSRDQRRAMYERLVGKPVAQGRFHITELLGFGGMGAVYEAVQTNMERQVALKLIPTHDPTTVARFEREALNTSKLRHPNTVTVFDFGQSEGGFLFLAMELLQGRTLSELIEEEGPLSPDRAVHIASQICRSLNEAHLAGIVHRDIKPDNIILIRVDNDPDVVKVLDFGIAKAVIGDDDVQLTGDGRIIGTPRYMSPEQILAETLDHRSDIYSLGCILFEMLCGSPPFQQSSTTALMISHTQDPPPGFAQRLTREHIEQMPGYLEHVVLRALAKDPNNRFQSVDEFREEMENALTSAPMHGNDPNMTAASLPSHITGNRQAIPKSFPTGSQPVPVMPAAVAVEKEKPSNAPKFAIVGILLLLVALVGIVAVGLNKSDTKEVAKVEPKVEKIKVEKTKPEEPAAPGYVHVMFASEPAGAEVIRNGKASGKKTPTMLAMKVGEPVEVTFRRSGYADYDAEVVPQKGASVEVKLRKKQTKVNKRPKPRPKVEEKPDPVVEEPVEEPKEPEVQMLQEDDKPAVDLLD